MNKINTAPYLSTKVDIALVIKPVQQSVVSDPQYPMYPTNFETISFYLRVDNKINTTN